MLLGGLAVLLAFSLGLTAGILAAVHQNSWIDYVVTFASTLGITVPNFIVAVWLLLVFAFLIVWPFYKGTFVLLDVADVTLGYVIVTVSLVLLTGWVGQISLAQAAFAAIGEAVGRSIEVLDLSVKAVTPGRDSLGRVLLQVRIDGKSLTGHGASTDIVDAGARALVHALNKVDHADGLEAAALGSSYFWGV